MKCCRQRRLRTLLLDNRLSGKPPRTHNWFAGRPGVSCAVSGARSKQAMRLASDSPDCLSRSEEAEPSSRYRPLRRRAQQGYRRRVGQTIDNPGQ